MANESGTWIMYGVSKDDPTCLHTVDEVIDYINEVGFLPLFKNEIPGFSLEERTVADGWWSGDTERDPWEWREIIARSGKVAYGKFFDKKAGFISLEWLPYFVNFRRDGYNFEGTLSGLEMKLYLCVRDFRQKKNKKGELYGWPIAVYTTPEHLFGKEFVSGAYRENPVQSERRIAEHMAGLYPLATPEQIRRVVKV